MCWLFKDITLVKELLSYQRDGEKLLDKQSVLDVVDSQWSALKSEASIELKKQAVFLVRYYNTVYEYHSYRIGYSNLIRYVPELAHYNTVLTYSKIAILPDEYRMYNDKTLYIQRDYDVDIEKGELLYSMLPSMGKIALYCTTLRSALYWLRTDSDILRSCIPTIVCQVSNTEDGIELCESIINTVHRCRLCCSDSTSISSKIVAVHNMHLLIMVADGDILWNTAADYISKSVL